MPERRLISLTNRYPNISVMTRWRIAHEPDFPAPVVIRRRKYYDDAELTKWEEAHRRHGGPVNDNNSVVRPGSS